MFFNLGEAAVDEKVFIQDLHLSFHSFLGFQYGRGLPVKAIMLLTAALPLVIDLNLSSIAKIFAYQISFQPDVKKELGKLE